MRKIVLSAVIVMIGLSGCSSRKEAPAKLLSGTAAYQLAKDLSATWPALNPDQSTVFVRTKEFDVTSGDVIQMFQDSMGNGAAQLKSLDAARLKEIIGQAAVQVGERKLLLAGAIRAKVSVPPDELKSALDVQYAQAGGEARLLESLKSNNVAVEDFKKRIQDNLMIQKYLQGVLAAAGQVTEAEVKAAYAEDKTASVRHILLLTQGKTAAQKAEIKKTMEGLLAKARAGEDFAALAEKFSEDGGSNKKGGLYEDFARGKMVKPFEDAAFSAPVGQVSDIVETEYGFHILKVEGRKKETQPFDEVKGDLESRLKEQKQQAAFETHMAGLKSQAKFEVLGLER
jgi:parvulin-like peptidyl-prolyl isomerase